MRNEQRTQLDWVQRSGNLRANIAMKTGQNVAAGIQSQAVGSAFKGLSSMYQGGAFSSDPVDPYVAVKWNSMAGPS